MRIDRVHPKGDRVLQLLEKGLTAEQIAARVGCSQSNVSALAADARRRRAQKEAAE